MPGWQREPRTLQLTPAPVSRLARLWARAEAAPLQKRWQACCSLHSPLLPQLLGHSWGTRSRALDASIASEPVP